MRNLFNISALLCAVALTTSCSNEEIVENGTAVDGFTLVATTGADTRTTVSADDNYNVTWTTGDAFYAFGNKTKDKTYSSRGRFTLKGAGGATGTFKGTVIGSMSALQYAVYPADNYDSGTMTLSFPNEYIYPVSNAPMFGKVNSNAGKVEFKQLLCGMMRVTLNGLEKNAEGSLTLTSNNTYITGSAALTIANDKATLSSLSDKQGKKITLSFKNEGTTGSLWLDIPLPAGTYGNDLTATLKIGSAEAVAFTTEDGFEIIDSEIKEMTELTISEVTSSTISFTKKVGNSADANNELTAGAKNITINALQASDALEIPANSSADDPVTINVSTATTGNFTVKGADGGAEAIKINLPEGSKGTVTVENIKSVEITGGGNQTTPGTVSDPLVIAATADAGVEELTVKEIQHVEVSGAWKKVTASTGDNTFVVKADAVIEDLTVEKGNIEIKGGGEVNKLTLNADMAINKPFFVPEGKQMAIVLGTHTLTLVGDESFGIDNCVRILKGASLTITGDEAGKGKIDDKAKGISLANDNAKFTMKNVNYSADYVHAGGILINLHASNAAVNVDNCTMQSVEYCLNTNAATPVGSGNTIALTNSTFTASETALMVNTPVTVTATGCTFTGGWQGALLRGGTFTFTDCGFNLSVTSYGSSSKPYGATSWSEGNQAPSAAITAGNRSSANYDYETTFSLKNCTFTVANSKDEQTYPSIYIDAETEKEKQGVTFNYDDVSKVSFDAAGTGLKILETSGKVTVNNEQYIVD